VAHKLLEKSIYRSMTMFEKYIYNAPMKISQLDTLT